MQYCNRSDLDSVLGKLPNPRYNNGEMLIIASKRRMPNLQFRENAIVTQADNTHDAATQDGNTHDAAAQNGNTNEAATRNSNTNDAAEELIPELVENDGFAIRNRHNGCNVPVRENCRSNAFSAYVREPITFLADGYNNDSDHNDEEFDTFTSPRLHPRAIEEAHRIALRRPENRPTNLPRMPRKSPTIWELLLRLS